jgi:predicted permease
VVERPFTAPFHNAPGLWMPLSTWHLVYAGKPVGSESNPLVTVVTRVRQDVSLAAAEAELTAIASTFDTSGDPERRAGARFDEDGRLGRPSPLERFGAITAVGVLIALVLLLACVNVANVLMASAATRQREIGLRLALGASRGRIVRQLLTESVIIATAAAGAGLLLTAWSLPLLRRLTRAPSTLDLSFDLNVYLFFVAIAFACGVGAGLLPSRIGARGDLMSPLKGSGTDGTSSAPRRLRSSLLAVQAAASILLLVVATLFLRAAGRAAQIDVGFDADRLVTYSVSFDRAVEPGRVKAYWATAIDRAGAIPGVERSALAQYPPFGGYSQVFIMDGPGPRMVTYFNRTSARYFDTVGLRLIGGRGFTDEEAAANAPVAVISETVARRHFADRNPLGGTLEAALGEKVTVIGIVNDAIVARLHEGTHGTVYMPLSPQHLKTEVTEPPRLVVRAADSPALIVRPVREALRSVDPTLTVRSFLVQDGLDEEVSQPRTVALIAGGMAALAVILAAIGLYGVTGSVVGQRMKEIGVRMALGAERRDVERQLLRESLAPVIAGLGAGLVLALIGGRAIAGVLYGVPPYDPIAFGGAAAILLVSAALAVLAPTRRAARVDPAFVLRQG